VRVTFKKNTVAWAELVYFLELVMLLFREHALLVEKTFDHEREERCLLHQESALKLQKMIHRPPREQLSRLEISMREFRWNSHRIGANPFAMAIVYELRAGAIVENSLSDGMQSQLASILRTCWTVAHPKKLVEKNPIYFLHRTP